MARTKPRVIRVISDLAQIPEPELSRCLRALHRALVRARKAHLRSPRRGTGPVPFFDFEWRPAEHDEAGLPSKNISENTPIESLELSQKAKARLAAVGALRLGDIASLTEAQVAGLRDIGAGTMARLRAMLGHLKLEFALPASEPVEEPVTRPTANAMRRIKRVRVKDSDSVTQLLLSTSLLSKLQATGIHTVGALKEVPPHVLELRMTRREVRQVLEAVKDTSLPGGLAQSHSAAPVDLAAPPDSSDAPVLHLRPWLGSCVDALLAEGILTLGQLQEAAEEDRLSGLVGIGSHSESRIREFLAKTGFQSLGSGTKG